MPLIENAPATVAPSVGEMKLATGSVLSTFIVRVALFVAFLFPSIAKKVKE